MLELKKYYAKKWGWIMKKKLLTLIMAMTMISLTACGNAVDRTKESVATYNEAVQTYNEQAGEYITAAQATVDANKELNDVMTGAQEVINKGEEPFDEETLTNLKAAMSTASDKQVADPELLPVYEEVTVDESASKEDLKAVKEKAEADTKAIQEVVIPEEIPEVPDYSEDIKAITESQKAYEDSIQGLKQITAPTDDFVMDRLKNIETIADMATVTEDHDPNGQLNKQGGYIGCIYFKDTQVDRSKLYIEKDNVIDIGTDGGGAIEIYTTKEEATSRIDYLGTFDSTGFASGSHYVYGTIVIRTSNYLTGTQQKELTQKILEELIKVK